MVLSLQAVKELKRVNLNILPNSAFGGPTHDLHGFSLVAVKHLVAEAGRVPDISETFLKIFFRDVKEYRFQG